LDAAKEKVSSLETKESRLLAEAAAERAQVHKLWVFLSELCL